MSAQKNKLQPLVLQLDGERITADRFLKAANGFFGVLRHASDDLSGEKGAIKWIVDVDRGSLILTATPEPVSEEIRNIRPIVDAIHKGISQIEKRDRRPKGFSDTALRHLKEVATVITDQDTDVTGIKVSYAGVHSRISQHTSVNITDILGPRRSEDGSVEGRVSVLSDRKRFEISIDDILTGHSVRCIPREITEQELIDSFRRRIIAIGTVHYRRDGLPEHIEVDTIRVLRKREDLPSIEDVKGIFRRGENGRT
jgi:hypothetical protein